MASHYVDKGRFRNQLATLSPGLSDRTIDRLINRLTINDLNHLTEGLDQTKMHHIRQFCRQLQDAEAPTRLQVIQAYAEAANV